MKYSLITILSTLLFFACAPDGGRADGDKPPSDFPAALLHWKADPGNPVFIGGGSGAWDERIRERGYILREGDKWHFW